MEIYSIIQVNTEGRTRSLVATSPEESNHRPKARESTNDLRISTAFPTVRGKGQGEERTSSRVGLGLRPGMRTQHRVFIPHFFHPRFIIDNSLYKKIQIPVTLDINRENAAQRNFAAFR